MGSMASDAKGKLTETALGLHLSATLEINERVQERLNSGKSVVHLGFGEATFPIHKDVLSAHREASFNTSYLPVAGLWRLREAIANFQTRRLGQAIDAKHVVVAPGSKPLLFALFDILKGDVLLPRPSWVSYEAQVMHAGKRLFWVETDEVDRHNITESSLLSTYRQAQAEGGNPRIMLVNSPSNPTGQIFSKDTTAMIASFCREHDIILISDEIYSDISFGHATASPFSKTDNTILTGGLSKTYSAGGWRVGFAVFPHTDVGALVQKAIMAYASECWSAASAPAQEAASVAFGTSVEMDLYRQQVTALHRHCTLRLYQGLKDCGLAVAEPKGAFYLYPSFHPFTRQLKALGIKTSFELSRWLINECGIAALPGSAFGEDDAGLAGGRYRLRMATSYLYFKGIEDRYSRGYTLLEQLPSKAALDLPLLDRAIEALRLAVGKLSAL